MGKREFWYFLFNILFLADSKCVTLQKFSGRHCFPFKFCFLFIWLMYIVRCTMYLQRIHSSKSTWHFEASFMSKNLSLSIFGWLCSFNPFTFVTNSFVFILVWLCLWAWLTNNKRVMKKEPDIDDKEEVKNRNRNIQQI